MGESIARGKGGNKLGDLKWSQIEGKVARAEVKYGFLLVLQVKVSGIPLRLDTLEKGEAGRGRPGPTALPPSLPSSTRNGCVL